MQVFLSGVITWSRFSERHGYDFNATLVLLDAGNLCIDPVEPGDDVLDRLAKEGVARILITNRNHTRAANRVRERTGAAVAIHPADATYAREQGTRIDCDLEVGQRVDPFTVVAVPGKSPGEVALHDVTRRLLIVGDAVIGNPPGQLSLLPDRVMDDPARLRASLRRLLELDFDALLVGDGVPIREGGRERLRELVASFPTDCGRILEAWGTGELCKRRRAIGMPQAMLWCAGACVKVTLLGHATVLVEKGPMRILMDPVLKDPFENGIYEAEDSQDHAKTRIDHEISQLRDIRS